MEECMHENQNLSIIDLRHRIFRCNDCGGDLYKIFVTLKDEEILAKYSYFVQ